MGNKKNLELAVIELEILSSVSNTEDNIIATSSLFFKKENLKTLKHLINLKYFKHLYQDRYQLTEEGKKYTQSVLNFIINYQKNNSKH